MSSAIEKNLIYIFLKQRVCLGVGMTLMHLYINGASQI